MAACLSTKCSPTPAAAVLWFFQNLNDFFKKHNFNRSKHVFKWTIRFFNVSYLIFLQAHKRIPLSSPNPGTKTETVSSPSSKCSKANLASAKPLPYIVHKHFIIFTIHITPYSLIFFKFSSKFQFETIFCFADQNRCGSPDPRPPALPRDQEIRRAQKTFNFFFGLVRIVYIFVVKSTCNACFFREFETLFILYRGRGQEQGWCFGPGGAQGLHGSSPWRGCTFFSEFTRKSDQIQRNWYLFLANSIKKKDFQSSD